MLSPTPAVKAAIFGIVAVTAAVALGAALHLSGAEAHAQDAARAAAEARAATVATVLDGLPEAARLGPFARAPGDDLILFDADGRPVAATDDGLARRSWRSVAESGEIRDAPDGTPHLAAWAGMDEGRAVVALAPVPEGAPDAVAHRTLVAAGGIWLGLVAVLLGSAWVAGPRAATRLRRLGAQIAQGETDAALLIQHEAGRLGALADAFLPVAERLRQRDRRAEGAARHIAALYQTNPHYVLLCGFDGEIVDANPAFYAATGLPPSAVRGGRAEALRETFPIEPLMDYARRSLAEESAIGGLDYAIVNRDDETRAVEVSLRAFELEGRKVVLIQATDRARQAELEHRVAAFTDTLELMVDQRVDQLAAGQQALARLLDAAGVVVASFDAAGATSRWNGAAYALTGVPHTHVPHFGAAVQALGLPPEDQVRFTQWYWSVSHEPFAGLHEIVGSDGTPRVRRVLWQRVDADMAGRSDLRSVVGVELPAPRPLAAEAPGGDGMAHADPNVVAG